MYGPVDKLKENTTRAVVNSASLKMRSGNKCPSFVDNRPEGIAQRKLQETLDRNIIQKRQRARGAKGRATRNKVTAGKRLAPTDKEGPLRISVEQAGEIPNHGVGRFADVHAVIPNITSAHIYASPISTQIADVNGMRLDQQQAGSADDRNIAIQNNISPRKNSQTFAGALIFDGAVNDNREGEDAYLLRMVKHALKQSNRDRHLYHVRGQRAIMSQENKKHSQKQEMMDANSD